MWQNIVNYLAQNWSEWLFRLVSIGLILLGCKITNTILQRVIHRIYKRRSAKLPPERKRRSDTAEHVLCGVIRYLIWFFALAAILSVLGLAATANSLLATAGIGGLAIGIGANSLIADVVAGLFLLFEDQISVGDYVKIGEVTGTVVEVTPRTVCVRGWRGELNTIPNGKIGVLTNYTRSPYSALLDITIAYEADVELAKRCMLEEAEKYRQTDERVTGAPVFLGMETLGDSGVVLRMTVPTTKVGHFQCQRILHQRIKERFKQEGVEIPYNKTVVFVQQEESHYDERI